MESARSVRDEQHRTTNVRSLFLKVGDKYVDEMSFEAEMLIPEDRPGRPGAGHRSVDHLPAVRLDLALSLR